MKKDILILSLIALISWNFKMEPARQKIELKGAWQFQLDNDNIGIQQKWFLTGLKDSIHLPGTTDSNKKGFLNKDTTTMHLSRLYKYEGAAWYRKKIVIPESFRNKHIRLFIERTRSSMIWIDSSVIGSSKLLQSPQLFDIAGYLAPGEHFITIRIDNSLKLTPYGNVHIYSDDTQTNWNGILGDFFIEASSKTYISNLQVYPDIDKKKFDIKLEIDNRLNIKDAVIELVVTKTVNGKTTALRTAKINRHVSPVIELEYFLGNEYSPWDEHQATLYSLTAIISNGEIKDSQTVPFGMRKFATKNSRFEINGNSTFLRGKHEAAVFPLTGYPPMDVAGWMRVYKIAKSYGINHYRFHSYCPPEAAFTAADRAGIYIQAELPFWGGLDADSLADMLKEEGLAMLKAYANHPSFVMFSPGNEIWSGHDRVEKIMLAFKQSDSRLLYTIGSNNNIGYTAPRPYADYFIGARTPYSGDTTLTHTRLTQSFADSKEGGILNTQTPSTEILFNYPVSHMNIPVVSHEVGQYQVYPDYREIEKYTGVLRPWNLEVFRNRLMYAGMLDQDTDFQKASGAWSALCYKAEMEAAIRTPGLAGFQLLDLQDFPGQGTALVGILDAFMDSKNVITKKEWLHSCNDVVLLLEFPKYCWTTKEKFHAKAVVANYSGQLLNKDLNWRVTGSKGNIIQKGVFHNLSCINGAITGAGEMEFDLSAVKVNEKINIYISMPGTSYENSYAVWVYNNEAKKTVSTNIIESDVLNDEIFIKLKNGANVLLFPKTEDVQGNSIPGLFPPEFWNYGMFKSISESLKKPVSPGTLGILTDPRHPIFNSFPTDFHTNWQWFSIIKSSNSFILDDLDKGYKPIVQVIDNLERNHKLGLIFEFKVGKGKLLVCMAQLNHIEDKSEAAQLYQSIIKYMNSGEFHPGYEINDEKLRPFFIKEK